MHFRIGTHVYNVRRKWDLRQNGQKADGLCDSTTKTIWLDADLFPTEILPVLRHEHVHAWQFETATPSTFEEQATFSATVGDAFDEEFGAQGGLDALIALPVDGLRGERRAPVQQRLDIPDRIQCGRCGAEIMAGSIHSGAPTLIESVAIMAIERGCACPVCDAVQTWLERCTPDGVPLGGFLRPKLLSGEAAREWLSAHPELPSPYNVA
jgi:hypothetical protein